MPHQILIRYGLMNQVGQFSSDTDQYVRGQTVVIRSHRGTELGEVLLALPPGSASNVAEPESPTRVLRVAEPADLALALQADQSRPSRFELCAQVVQERDWPLELIDVEPLLDDRRTVLHYLGPHRLDLAEILATFRDRCNMEVMLEAVGRDLAEEEDEAAANEEADSGGCGSCGSGGSAGCGSGGGCGSGDGGGCSTCGVKSLLAARRRKSS